MNKTKIIFLVILGLLIIWGLKVMDEFELHAEKQTSEDYLKYVEEYQSNIRSKIDDFEVDLGETFDLQYDPAPATVNMETCKNSNFEGADVRIHGIQFYNKVYGQASTDGYHYDCNRVTLDPDHPYFGLPDISVSVSPVEYFKPKNTTLTDFVKWMGTREEEGPYRTYEKQILITDSTGETKIRRFAMELWLTRFNVSVSINASRDAPNVDFTENELSQKIYPRYWYGSADPGKLSVNDLDRKEEFKDYSYGNIQMVLEVNPNASPWYIKTDHAQTARPKIAVAGVYCQHFEKKSLEAAKLDFNTFAGKANPLYFNAFEKTDQLLNAELTTNSHAFFDQINEINEQNIWDRPYYIRLSSQNIGSRRKLLSQQDDQVNMEFLMPLFVVGSLDVVIPSGLLARWDPPEPYQRKFGLSNLLPRWGLKGFGRVISIIIVVVVLVLSTHILFPVLKFLR